MDNGVSRDQEAGLTRNKRWLDTYAKHLQLSEISSKSGLTAYKQKIGNGRDKRGDDGQMYVYNLNGVPLPFEQMLSEYPLEKLKKYLCRNHKQSHKLCQASITAVSMQIR